MERQRSLTLCRQRGKLASSRMRRSDTAFEPVKDNDAQEFVCVLGLRLPTCSQCVIGWASGRWPTRVEARSDHFNAVIDVVLQDVTVKLEVSGWKRTKPSIIELCDKRRLSWDTQLRSYSVRFDGNLSQRSQE